MKTKGVVILPDGKICSGKSTYSKKLRDELGGVMLVVDEAILKVFGVTPDMERVGQEYGKLIEYVMEIAADMALHGTTVVLESGYFSKAERDWYKKFFVDRGVPYEWHFLEVNDETWNKNIASRNRAHDEQGESHTFYITDEFLKMFKENFVIPERDEVDVWVDNNY
ncbi:MAG: ATP-binding protein [Oscillospiraceae bacterium]|jgi:predicted kinase|nr:ATP-binding protein [Oscillospiraceae bacterium]